MELYLGLFLISIAGLGIATYTDLKQRIIHNKLNYSLIGAGLFLHLWLAFSNADYWIFGTALAVTAVTFAASYALWKAGVWAGGDVKLMTGIAALNPLNLNILQNVFGVKIGIFASISTPMFPLTLFIFSIFAMLPYGALISANALRKKTNLKKELVQDLKRKVLQSVEVSAAVVGISAVLMFFGMHLLLVLPALIVLKLLKKPGLVITGALFVFALYYNVGNAVAYAAYLFVFFMFIYILFKFYFISKKVLAEEMEITALEDGIIPAESIYLKEGKAIRGEKIQIKKIINYFKANNLQGLRQYLSPAGEEIVSARKARGVTVQEIEKLKMLVKEGKLENKIEIKKSAPFVPAILMAYVALNIVGDLLWNLLL